MDEVRSLIDQKEYGRVKVCLAEVLEKKGITRNRLRTLPGVKYEVIDRYYKAENIEMVDLNFLAKICYTLNVDISDLLKYEK